MEKKSFSKRLVDYFFCGHKELLFMGGLKGSLSNKKTYVYACKNCGKLIKTSYRLEFPDVHVSTTIVNGKIEFAFRGKASSTISRYDIDNFHRHMIESDIEYGREQLKLDLKYLEDIINSTYNQNVELIHKLRRTENVVTELKKQNELLSSVAENKDNVIYNEKQLSILDKNEMQLHNSGMLKEWLMSLLLENKVLIPRQAFKLFKTLLTVVYGYESMRRKWVFVNKQFDNVDYVEVLKLNKRRTEK